MEKFKRKQEEKFARFESAIVWKFFNGRGVDEIFESLKGWKFLIYLK